MVFPAGAARQSMIAKEYALTTAEGTGITDSIAPHHIKSLAQQVHVKAMYAKYAVQRLPHVPIGRVCDKQTAEAQAPEAWPCASVSYQRSSCSPDTISVVGRARAGRAQRLCTAPALYRTSRLHERKSFLVLLDQEQAGHDRRPRDTVILSYCSNVLPYPSKVSGS
eukprot:6203794-Pleurochrysis_carterae.AAC.5